MKIIDTLSHMPFQDGADLYFCHSPGAESWEHPQTEFARHRGIAPERTDYQPWCLAKQSGGAVTTLDCPFPPDSPFRLFCNPVVSGGEISFVYDRTLWKCPLALPLVPVEVVGGIYAGFSTGERTVVTELKSLGSFREDGGPPVASGFDHILRIVPHGSALVMTGVLAGETFSILRQPDGSRQRIQVGGEDVYKCCLDGADVIHAVRAGGFEERYVHRDTAELIPF